MSTNLTTAALTGQSRIDARGLGLRPWHEVAAEFNRRTGENLTRQEAWYIAQKAERKLREQLKEIA